MIESGKRKSPRKRKVTPPGVEEVLTGVPSEALELTAGKVVVLPAETDKQATSADVIARAKRSIGSSGMPTPELTKVIVDCLLVGSYLDDAYAVAGISKSVARTWLARGARALEVLDDPERLAALSPEEREDLERQRGYAEFNRSVRGAISECTLRDLRALDQMAEQGAWQVRAFRLERRNPKGFSRDWNRPGVADEIDPTSAATTAVSTKGLSPESVESIKRHALGIHDDVRTIEDVEADISRLDAVIAAADQRPAVPESPGVDALDLINAVRSDAGRGGER